MMSLAATTDMLLQSAGKRVNNRQGNYLGEVVEITRDPSGEVIEYIIISSNRLLDQEDRFSAIPLSSSIIRINGKGGIILLVKMEELHLACGTTPNMCPKPNHLLNPLIFELFEYSGTEFSKNTSKLE